MTERRKPNCDYCGVPTRIEDYFINNGSCLNCKREALGVENLVSSQPQTFAQWFKQNLEEHAEDIVRGGCDAGFPGITYTGECADLFDKYVNEIMSRLREICEEMGESNIMSFVQSFGRSDMAEHWFETGVMDDMTKNLLVWFMCEELAHERVRLNEENER